MRAAASAREHCAVRHCVRPVVRRYRLAFFFQAEDGIRDRDVTGVQTCALPIYKGLHYVLEAMTILKNRNDLGDLHLLAVGPAGDFGGSSRESYIDHVKAISDREGRSEERRVGKECRTRWWSYA